MASTQSSKSAGKLMAGGGGEAKPDVSRVKAAHLERNGDISVIMKG